MTNAIELVKARANHFASMKNAAPSMQAIANLIDYSKGVSGYKWIAENCEAQSKVADREDHAAQFRVIAKRLRRVISEAA